MEQLETVQRFRIFVFNDQGHIMMVQKNNLHNLPCGQIAHELETLEVAARRVVFAETKTALNAVVPVTVIKTKKPGAEEVMVAILVARTNGEAQINSDEKTWHRYMSEATFLLHPSYRNKLIKKLYEAARQALVCEEIRMGREEEAECRQESII